MLFERAKYHDAKQKTLGLRMRKLNVCASSMKIMRANFVRV